MAASNILASSLPGSPPRVARFVRAICVALAAALTLLSLQPAFGADEKKADREARRAQLLQQRLEQEEAAWQAERSDLQKKLGDAEASAAALKAESGKLAGSLDKASREAATSQKKVADLTKRLAAQADAVSQQQAANKSELDHLMQAREQERVAQNTRFDSQTSRLQTCSDKNQRLLSLGHELLVRYRNKGVTDALLQADPVLGIRDIETFTLVQDYRDKLDAEQFAPDNRVKP